VGQAVRGELTARSGKLDDDSHFQDYTYAARRGDRLVALLESTAFDAFLHAGRRAANGTLENVVSDDDGGGGTNARVTYLADRDGPVTFRVNTLEGGETGSYTLTLVSAGPARDGGTPERGPGAAASPLALQAGRAVTGELAAGDQTLSDGSLYDVYTYQARRGERVVVRMSSDDFDTVLAVSGAGGSDMVMDDDGGGGTNSRAEYTAQSAGPVMIRANALSSGQGGRYTIVIEAAR
jgi:hypothetical protein